jgi:hypothetical protein
MSNGNECKNMERLKMVEFSLDGVVTRQMLRAVGQKKVIRFLA